MPGRPAPRGRAPQRAAAALAALLMAACSRDVPAPAALAPPPARAAAAELPALFVPELMEWLVEPAAAVLFAAADRHGWASLEPGSTEAWQAVEEAAGELQRSAGLLAAAAPARGHAAWSDGVSAQREGAAAAAAAARRHDPRGLFAAAAQLRAGCQGCHAQHAPDQVAPR